MEGFYKIGFNDVIFTTKLMRVLHHYKKGENLNSRERDTLQLGSVIFQEIYQYADCIDNPIGHIPFKERALALYASALKVALEIAPKETDAPSFFGGMHSTLEWAKTGKREKAMPRLELLMNFLKHFHDALSEEVSSRNLEELAIAH